MFLTRSEYDRGVNTFSPEGRLFQVEYAIEAIKIGTTAIGISTSEGVVIAVEKRLLSPLQEPASVEKIYEVDSHIGVAMSGLSADARTLVDHARSESQVCTRACAQRLPSLRTGRVRSATLRRASRSITALRSTSRCQSSR